jgi:hypothetical protein
MTAIVLMVQQEKDLILSNHLCLSLITFPCPDRKQSSGPQVLPLLPVTRKQPDQLYCVHY